MSQRRDTIDAPKVDTDGTVRDADGFIVIRPSPSRDDDKTRNRRQTAAKIEAIQREAGDPPKKT